jgi:hypothetical protein
MSGDPFRDIPVWRDLARLMPGWQPTLRGLQRLGEGPNELLVALRAIAREWRRDDARWDVLQGVLEYYKRQHAHELAEKIRAAGCQEVNWCGCPIAADLIDPEVLNGE